MSGNTFGKLFQVTTYGESHGKALGCIIDGCPPQLEISTDDIQSELNRRKPGQSDVTTQRKEDDVVEILSGVFEGKTLGTPISLIVYNQDQRSKDYSNIKDVFRPNHADITYHNHRKFVLDPAVQQTWQVQDVTQGSIPEDFSRNRRIHACWRLTHR